MSGKTKWITVRVDSEFHDRVSRVVAHKNTAIEDTAIRKITKTNWALWALETKLIEEEEELLLKGKKKLASEKKAIGWK